MRALCHSDEIAEGQSKGFDLEDGTSIFVVRKHDKLYIYKNHCPHLGINLEWMPDQFLDNDNCLIQCSMHGALFLIDNGHCISGPCQGEDLTGIPFTLENGFIILQPTA